MLEKKIVTLDHRMDNGMSAVSIQSDGAFLLEQDGKRIRRFHSGASVRDGRKIDTRTASRVDIREENYRTTDAMVRNAISLVGLSADEKKSVGKYSLGMRQRLGIAQALKGGIDYSFH